MACEVRECRSLTQHLMLPSSRISSNNTCCSVTVSKVRDSRSLAKGVFTPALDAPVVQDHSGVVLFNINAVCFKHRNLLESKH